MSNNIHINPLIDRDNLIKILTKILDNIKSKKSEIDYRLIGTSAALLHGITLPVGDIDILVKERETVDQISDSLKEYTCIIPPTELKESKQYYTEYSIDEIEIGISTVEIDTDVDWIETYGPGPWIHYSKLECGSYVIPTVNLEIRLLTELLRKRPERYHPIIEHLIRYEYDHDLVKRGILGLSITPEETILKRLNI